MKLRQVALAAEELAPIRDQLFQRLGLEADFADPGVGEFGLENSVMAIGDTFLEVVAPTQENTAAGRTLARRGLPVCGYMALFQVDNFAEFDATLEQKKCRRVWQIDREEVSACHVHPKDMRGAIVSFDEMRPAAEWVWGGPDWRGQEAKSATRILGCTVGSPEVKAIAARWSEILDVPLDHRQRMTFTDGTFVDFVEGEHEGIVGISFEVAAGQSQEGMLVGDVELKFEVSV
ncbi:MAG: hypothetical protein GKR90_21730 [Pseudomonadales bacterium]|nr:hypothetical protein [Pseudomonadales bacterium]